MTSAIASRKAVMTARGGFGSGMTEQWKEQVNKDRKLLFQLEQGAPKSEERFEKLGVDELGNKLVAVHEVQSKVNILRERYESALHSDDEARKQIAEDHRARLPRI